MNVFNNLPFRAKNSLILDLNSNGIAAYFIPDSQDITQINFNNLHLISRKKLTISKSNSVAHVAAFKKNLLNSVSSLEKQVMNLKTELNEKGISNYKLYLLIAAQHCRQEKEAIKATTSSLSWGKQEIIERAYFYWYYLEQNKNYSRDKFLIVFFADCLEFSFFHQQELIGNQIVSTENYLEHIVEFWQEQLLKVRTRGQEVEADCCYLFDQMLEKGKIDKSLSQALKLETIRVKGLC